MTARPLVAVTVSEFARRDPAPLGLLERSRLPFRLNTSGKRPNADELVALAHDAAGVVAGMEHYDAATLDRLPGLRCISRVGVGVDHIDLEAAQARGIVIAITPRAATDAVAELGLTFILALHRRLVPQANAMRRREWARTEAHLLRGRCVALLGLGRIGRRLAELLAPFQVRLLAVDPRADVAECARAGIELVALDDALRRADVVAVQAARESAHPLRIGRAELALCRPGAVLVNVARGSMVDGAALHDALTSGRLAAAALDVFEEEPYRGPLCELDNVILTPHSATDPTESRIAMETEAVENVLRTLAGELDPSQIVAPPAIVRPR